VVAFVPNERARDARGSATGDELDRGAERVITLDGVEDAAVDVDQFDLVSVRDRSFEQYELVADQREVREVGRR
jgi:hypothetical protein